MAGGLMQLVAYGAQDVYLTGNPKVTFFQAVYKRHTNFAMENIEQTTNGNPSNNGRISVTVARNGDLIGDMYVELTSKTAGTKTAAATDCNFVAERAIKTAELSIGGQRIDKHYQRWWRMYSELYLDESKKANWGKMTSGAGQVFLPLIFFFNRNPGLYLPLIALQYHEVRVDFDLTDEFEHYFNANTFKVWGNYVYLDTEERRRFAQKGHEYLIEQVQHTGVDSVSAGETKQVRLSYNHPIKELVWAVAPASSSNAKLWNFTSNVNSDDVVLESNPAAVAHSNCFVPLTQAAGVPMYSAGIDGSLLRLIEEGNTDDAAASAVGPVETFKLVLNGQDRFKEQSGKYFNQVQAYNHHSGSPMPGIYSYSFALKPEEHQPTGTCNFSRIDNAQVAIKIKSDMDTGAATSLNMFATNYNVLRIQSGMGGLAFSN
jgi:hypothetical protein